MTAPILSRRYVRQVTVVVDPGRLSWKVSVPISILLLAIAIAIWLVPNPFPIFLGRTWATILGILGDISAAILAFMLLSWSIWGTKK